MVGEQDLRLGMMRRILDRGNDVVVRIRLSDMVIEYIDGSTQSLGGHSAEEFYKDSTLFFDLIHPDDRKLVMDTIGKMRSGILIPPPDYRVLYDDGTVRWARNQRALVRDDSGHPIALEAIIRDITDEKEALLALERSEIHYRNLFESMLNGFALHEMVFDEEGTPIDYIFLEVNSAFEEMTGLQRGDILGKRITMALPGIEDDPADWIGTYGNLVMTGEEARFEQFSDVLGKWFSIYAYCPVEGQFAVLFTDITEKREFQRSLERSLNEKSILLKEIHHRVNNNMQLISSLLSLQLGKVVSPEVDRFVAESKNRILSMAMVHEELYRSDDLSSIPFGNYIERLVRTLAIASGSTDFDIRFDVDDVDMPIDTAIPCGLIVTELVTNAFKYGRSEDGSGSLEITLRCVDSRYILEVKDNGAGFEYSETGSPDTLGLMLVRELSSQLKGDVTSESLNGTTMTVTFG